MSVVTYTSASQCNFANYSQPARASSTASCGGTFDQTNLIDPVSGETTGDSQPLLDWTNAWENPKDVGQDFNSAGRKYTRYSGVGTDSHQAPAAYHCQSYCLSHSWMPDGTRISNCGLQNPKGAPAGQEWRGGYDSNKAKACHIGYWDRNNMNKCCNIETGFGDSNPLLCAPSWAPITAEGASSTNAVTYDGPNNAYVGSSYEAAELGTCDNTKATKDYCFSKDPLSGNLNVASGGVCQAWCNRIGDDCDQQMIAYCDPELGDNAGNPECACLQPEYNPQYQDLLAVMTQVGVQPQGNLACFFGPCKDDTSTLKTEDKRLAAMNCQSVQMSCINNVTNIVPIQVDPDDINKNNIAAVTENLSNQCDMSNTTNTTCEEEPNDNDGTGTSNTPDDGDSPTCSGDSSVGTNDTNDTNGMSSEDVVAASSDYLMYGGIGAVVFVVIVLLVLGYRNR